MSAPFTTAEFLEVFGRYNLAVWPAQILLSAAGALLMGLVARGRSGSSRWASALLALLWLWMGVVYHWGFFSSINPAAYLFGALFVLQAVVFVHAGVLHSRIRFRIREDATSVAGAGLITYALLVYPVIGAAAGHGFPASPTFGLPCPTTIFTFGVLLWADGRVPLRLIPVPLAWSLLGASAAASFGIVEDLGLPVAGIAATALILNRNRLARQGLEAGPPALPAAAR